MFACFVQIVALGKFLYYDQLCVFFSAAAFVWKSLSACLQELQNLMAKQHDEELQRLRIDLEEMQQSSRKVHGQLSYLEVRWGCLHVLFLVNRVFFWMVMREWVVGCLNMREVWLFQGFQSWSSNKICWIHNSNSKEKVHGGSIGSYVLLLMVGK